MQLETTLTERNGESKKLALAWERCVAVGYAGRNRETVLAHVRELETLGVPAPSSVPSFYWVDPTRVSAAETLSVVGDRCSGEVEFFAAPDASGAMYVTVASDHTDRKLEAVSVSKAKQCCTKIVGTEFWRCADVLGHWDELVLRAWVRQEGKPERLYQEGPLSLLLPLDSLIELSERDAIGKGTLSLFGGTIPTMGDIAYGGSFRMELADPVLKRAIRHAYRTVILPDRN